MLELFRLNEPPRPRGAPGRTVQRAPATAGLPAVACPTCGRTWSTHVARVYGELPYGHPLAHQSRDPVPPGVFREMARQVREALALPPETPLLPGTDLGPLALVCRHSGVAEFEWPDFRTLIVTDPVPAFLEEGGFTGWRLERVRLVQRPRKAHIPKLHELVIEGRGGLRTHPEPEVSFECAECGRREMTRPPLEVVELVEAEWDGSDLLRLPAPLAQGIYVTRRLKEALEATSFRNYVLTPLAEEIEAALRRSRAACSGSTEGEPAAPAH